MSRFWFALTLAVVLASSVTLHASVVLSENFDELQEQLSVMSAGAFSTINGTNVDIVGPNLFPGLCAPPESGNCVDMDGSGGNSQGQLQSNMQFGPGTYFLSFDLIGSQRGPTAATTVTFGDYNQTFTLASNDDIDGIVLNQPVTLTSPGYLLFVSDTPGDVGNLLDNVVVTTVAVPEPSSLLLLASGVFGVAGYLRRLI